jgi:D-alanyl-D-alanine carboxypeptidase
MLRIRTGARYGLRWGVFGFVAAIVAIPSSPTQAAPYADIVVDANTGTVLHSTNPDAQRHPASLTKIMTLYLLFEQLEAGKLKLDSQLKVSEDAAGQNPTKLGLKPGSTLAVEDAIKGMVTRSANDAAVVVAEAIAGDEREFAKLMTRKAQALGMGRTVYKNASGLPDNDQVTTARDQSILGRAVQERFPRYYKYFSIRTFTFRGQSISNHNHLLGKVEGVDGIKTGYINASGFNLVTSVHRGNRYLVAVVMGGGSGASRDARMRDLINDKIAQASTKRTTSMFAEAGETPESKPEPKVAAKPEPKPESKSEPKVAAKAEPKAETKVAETKVEPKVEAKAETKPEPKAKGESRFAVASAISVPVRFGPPGSQAEPAVARPEPAAARVEPAAAAAPTPSRIAAGSIDPIRPVLVKTLTVRAGAQIAAVAPLNNPSSAAAETQPIRVAAPVAPAAPVATTVVAAKPEAPAQPVAVPAAKPEQPTPAPAAAAKTEVTAPPPAPAAIAKSEPPAAAPAPAAIATSDPPAPAPAPAAAAKPEPAAPAPVAATKPQQPTPLPTARPATPPARTASADPARTAPAAKPQHRSGWIIQVGAYPAERAAKERLSSVQSKASKMLTGAEAFTETIEKGGTTYYRARFAGLDKDKAEAACKYLKKNDVECVTIKN